MSSIIKVFSSQIFVLLIFFSSLLSTRALLHHYKFVVKEAEYTRLCSSKNILTVNGQFPGPTLKLHQGDTVFVDVYNRGRENITIHWHGVKQPRYPWSDGPEFITQCPIQPGNMFSQRIKLSDEIGTLWWHAHSDWSRASVHGLLVVYPKKGDNYPFPKPQAELPIVLGEWWKSDIRDVVTDFQRSGGLPKDSDAFLINGQPGDLYPCSRTDASKLRVDYGKTYLVRMVNAAMNNILFFSIAKHQISVVGSDGSYTKQFKTDYIAISPGQTVDFLLEANKKPHHYYIAAKAFNSGFGIKFQKTTTALLEYRGNYAPSSSSFFPNLPNFNDSNAITSFMARRKSLAPANVPLNVNAKLFITLSVTFRNCEAKSTCTGPFGWRFAASLNNISFVDPNISILEAYHKHAKGIYDDGFPRLPRMKFNYTADNRSEEVKNPDLGTGVRILEYNSTVEIVFQGTNLATGGEHPMHLHGYSFYVVGSGPGNFDKKKDRLNYNLVDPPLVNTIVVPRNGWSAIRFRANNPGVWFMHCHIERHASWGMGMAFIVKDGNRPEEQMLPPPPGLPPC